LPDFKQEVKGNASSQTPGLGPGVDESVEAHKVRLDPPLAHCVNQLPCVVKPARTRVHTHHGVEHLDGGALARKAEEELLRERVLARAPEDADGDGDGAGSRGAAPREPLEDVERAPPGALSDGAHDEGDLVGRRPRAVEHVVDGHAGGQREDGVREPRHARAEVPRPPQRELAQPLHPPTVGARVQRLDEFGGLRGVVGVFVPPGGPGGGRRRGGDGGGGEARRGEVREAEVGPSDSGISEGVVEVVGGR
jgi:hypothetical protein